MAEEIIEKPAARFKGYTLEELRYQRAMTALQKEFAKSRIAHKVNNVRKRSFFGKDTSTSTFSKVGGIAAKLLSGVSYLDYAMLGMTLFKSGKKIYSFFRRNRKG